MTNLIVLFLLAGCGNQGACDATWYLDLDGDGVGGSVTVQGCPDDETWVAAGGDCDDGDEAVLPGAPERCNGWDDDCDGTVDEDAEGAVTAYPDADGDGHGEIGGGHTACAFGVGELSTATDCDDGDVDVHPGATEVCDGVDEDCDGVVDNGAVDATTLYSDLDGDCFGDPDAPEAACGVVDGLVADNTDCDDADPDVWPGAPTVCAFDQDCDGLVGDEDTDSSNGVVWFADADGDGYGNYTVPHESCTAPASFVITGGDCDDGDATAFPGGVEVCGGGDEDCDGLPDELDADVADLSVYFTDADGDGYGDFASVVLACDPPPGAVELGTDCDDGDIAINPGEDEICAGGDEDCDGLAADDDPSVTDASSLYTDADRDGYGDPGSPVVTCDVVGVSDTDDDCDDGDGTIYPGARDVCDDGHDGDCYGGDQSCLPIGDWGTTSADARLLVPNGGAGFSVAGAGDLNADGYGDAMVGAVENDTAGPMGGAAAVYFGPFVGDTDVTTEGVLLVAESENDHAGTDLAALGDLDGDGLPEILVGAYYMDPAYSGMAYLVSGATMATLAPGDEFSLTNADATFPGDQSYDYMGNTATLLGDVNDDGLGDFLIGATGDSTSGYHAGASYLWHGQAFAGEYTTADAAAVLLGEGSGSHSGGDLSAIGDYDGDGLDDILIGAEAEDHVGVLAGCAYVFLSPVASGSLADGDLLMDGETEADLAGASVAGAGDTNGDGYQDVLVGARAAGRTEFEAGAAYLVLGPTTGSMSLADADAIIDGPLVSAQAGYSVAAGSDIDGDGDDDIAIGSWRDSTTGVRFGGSVAVYYGPVAGTQTFSSADWWIHGTGGSGASVAFLEVEDDGLSDLLIGAPSEGGGGAAFYFEGRER